MDYFPRRYSKPGAPPGVLEDTGQAPGPLSVHLMHFDAEDVHADGSHPLTGTLSGVERPGIKWIDVCGELDTGALTELGRACGLHPLALEDVHHKGQRAKLDDYGDHLVVILALPVWQEQALRFEQVTMFFKPGLVVSVHDSHAGLFEPVRERIRNSPNGRIRSSGADYLLYALVDLVVDSGFPVLESYAGALEALEAEVLQDPHARDLTDRIHEIRRELVFFRRTLWSQRDATAALLRTDLALVTKASRLYLRDCHDHAVQILELAESYRDMAGALFDLQLNAMSRRANDIMRVLTMIATIFIPLTFIAGIYGMNFDPDAGPLSMPELAWPYGYIGVLGVMATLIVGMLVYFKRKGWF